MKLHLILKWWKFLFLYFFRVERFFSPDRKICCYLYLWALPADKQPMDYTNITAFPLSLLNKLQPATRTAIADSRHLVLNCLLFLEFWKQGHDSSYSLEIENAQAEYTQGNCNLALSLSRLLSFTATLHCIAVLQSSQGAYGAGEELHHRLLYSQTTEPRLRSSFTLYLDFIELLSIKRRQTHCRDVCSMTVLWEEKKNLKVIQLPTNLIQCCNFGRGGGRKESSHFNIWW